MKKTPTLAIVTLSALLAGCPNQSAGGAGNDMPMDEAPPPTNRIDVPPAVRQNLGITFVRAERRAVAATLRYPGRFELSPSATRAFSARVPGEVVMHAVTNQRVESGQLLAVQESPEAAALIERLAEADARIATHETGIQLQRIASHQAQAELSAAESALRPLEQEAKALLGQRAAVEAELGHWRGRISELERLLEQRVAVADQLADARAQLLSAGTALAAHAASEAALATRRNELELAVDRARSALAAARETVEAGEAEIVAARRHRAAIHAHAVAVLGVSPEAEELSSRIEFRADRAGVVVSSALTGSWLDAGETVATVVQPDQLQLRVSIPVTELPSVRGIGTGRITQIGSLVTATVTEADLQILDASPSEFGMTDLLLLPREPLSWAVAGMTARAELVKAGGERRIAIPVRAAIQDGLEILAFIRDPANPDKVIRQPVTLGVSDGEWVVVETGVGPDEELVLDGIYELKLTGAGKALAGGHFHADGTFHAGPD